MTNPSPLSQRPLRIQKLPPEAPGENRRYTTWNHHAHIQRTQRVSWALQLACGHQIPNDTAESIVDRAEKYAAFLSSDAA